ncbi:hypothetical protein [Actinoplanes aureus]|uniref:Uncharacterized protein n=1 Tax=Actinoplanes aureus TaxID=2792083 RepID=A0A931C5T1_9ACTN|nr:hypothetical protein [Actinoplanes aureus]MBG0562759.1 hypothetical protein [Actinoplanes aureus]
MSGVDQVHVWVRRLRHAGSRVLSTVGNLATPVDRPARSEDGVNTLVATVTLAAGLIFLLVMLVTWLTR